MLSADYMCVRNFHIIINIITAIKSNKFTNYVTVCLLTVIDNIFKSLLFFQHGAIQMLLLSFSLGRIATSAS